MCIRDRAKVYRKNSLPGFEDKSHDEALIEDLSFKVIQMLQKCYAVMKRLKAIYMSQFVDGKQLSREELIILDNLQKKYAEKIQTESNKFRVLQNNYLKFLNKDDLKPIRNKTSTEAVSYTHLDVYKRQPLENDTLIFSNPGNREYSMNMIR